MAEAPCELCGHAGPMRPHFPGQGIVRCPGCELVFWSGSVDARALYTREYFEGGEYLDYAADRKILERNFAGRVRDLARLVPRGRLLEIGSAYGFFLALAARRWQVRGFEVFAEGVEHARSLGLDCTHGDFLDAPDEPASQDVICLWDTIEHLARPVRVLEKAARWLRPGGVLAVTTGDVGSLVARWRQERWRQIHPPTHLYYFSSATLSRACEKAGLEVVGVTHPGQYRSYSNMVHSLATLGRKTPAGFVTRLATFDGRLDLPVYLNLFDIMQVIARKPRRGST